MARTCLIYGPTGSTKTSNLGQIVDYLYERYGVPSRGVFGDNRGPLQTQVNSGRLIPWDIYTHPDPLSCIVAASKGYWPVRLVDGVAITDERGNLLRLTTDKEMQGLAAYFVEGLTENGALIMRDRETKGVSTGEPLVGLDNPVESIIGSDFKMQYRMTSRGTHFFAQNVTHGYVKNGFSRLNVPWAFFTAHQKRTFDKFNNPANGPVIVGKALVDVIPQWFDMCIHMEKFMQEVQVVAPGQKTGRKVLRQGARAYFDSHRDADIPTVIWPAKLGVPPELKVQILDRWPEGCVPLVLTKDSSGNPSYASSLRHLIQMIDEHSDSQQQDAAGA